MSTEIRRLLPSDWSLYRQLRLAALKDSPEAFGSTYSHAVLRPDGWWQSRVSDAETEMQQPMVAFHDGAAAGLAWSEIEPPDLTTAHLYQMWVHPHHRGVGLGRMLVNEGIRWARAQDAKRMLLEVTCGDRPARRLYEAMGFVVVGEPVPQRPGEPLMEQSMVLEFHNSISS